MGLTGMTDTRNSALNDWQQAEFKRERFTTTDQVELTYYDSGPRPDASATLVFVPGWSMPGWIWLDIAKQMRLNYRVVVFDPRGQGNSSVANEGYQYSRRAQDIHELLSACKCERFVMIGWSLGGLETLQWSQRFPHPQLKGIVLVDHSVGVGKPPTWDPTFLSRLRADQSKAMTAFVKGMFAKTPDPVWTNRLIQQALHLPLTSSVQLLSQSVPREYWRDAVVHAPVPVAYWIIPKFAEQAKIIQQLRPNIDVEIFQNAGHALFIDQSEQFSVSLYRFMGGIR